MTIFHGHVPANKTSFHTGADGIERFEPMNTAYATVTPGPAPDRTLAVELELADGEFFQVREDLDKSEGRGGTSPAGNFLHYPDACRAARGKGAQGSIATIVIMTPDGLDQVSATAEGGSTVILDIVKRWRSVDLSQRLTFVHPPNSGQSI